MINFIPVGQSIQIVAGAATQTLTADLDVKASFWPVLKKGMVEKSKRAKELLDQALRCDEVLWIIGDRVNAEAMGGAAYGAYDGDVYKHVMVWDPTATLNFDPTGVWAKKPVSKWAKPGTKETATFKGKGGSMDLPPHVVLLHELGHFDQFLNWPAYKDKVRDQRGPDSAKLFKGCQGDIEAHNLASNEWPICSQLGITKRQSYWDRPGEVRLVENLDKFNVKFA
ncbi:MAG: hypothetical protein P8R43_06780 [Planctomycetota bacterium]|nr:hypothetical protein [Planctomycetota bacterium]